MYVILTQAGLTWKTWWPRNAFRPLHCRPSVSPVSHVTFITQLYRHHKASATYLNLLLLVQFVNICKSQICVLYIYIYNIYELKYVFHHKPLGPFIPRGPGGPLRPGNPLAPECPGKPLRPATPGGPGGPGGPGKPAMPDSGLVRLSASWASCSVIEQVWGFSQTWAGNSWPVSCALLLGLISWCDLIYSALHIKHGPCITLMQTCLMCSSVGPRPWKTSTHE